MSALPPVLTVATLARQGLAREVPVTIVRWDGSKRDDTRFEISARGQAALRENQRARADWFRAHPDEQRASELAPFKAAIA